MNSDNRDMCSFDKSILCTLFLSSINYVSKRQIDKYDLNQPFEKYRSHSVEFHTGWIYWVAKLILQSFCLVHKLPKLSAIRWLENDCLLSCIVQV